MEIQLMTERSQLAISERSLFQRNRRQGERNKSFEETYQYTVAPTFAQPIFSSGLASLKLATRHSSRATLKAKLKRLRYNHILLSENKSSLFIESTFKSFCFPSDRKRYPGASRYCPTVLLQLCWVSYLYCRYYC